MKTIPLKKLVSFLDSELALSEFPGDDSANGLQVEGKKTVRKVGLAVDACTYVFEKAVQKNIDLLFVHHGLIWGGLRSISGITKNRMQILLRNDISLYACHLPLDWHPVCGNNAQLLKRLHLKKAGDFGKYHGRSIGYWGRLPEMMTPSEFLAYVSRALGTKATAIPFRRNVRNVGVVSGGGWSAIMDADKCGIDTFLTGEPSHSAYTPAEEMGINLVFAGHYATETFGVQAVGQMLRKKYGLDTEFIDHPTGL